MSYGIDSGELRAEILDPEQLRASENGERRGEVELGVYGRHNALNSLAAAALACRSATTLTRRPGLLEDLGGVRRRFQSGGGGRRSTSRRRLRPPSYGAIGGYARRRPFNYVHRGRVIAVFQPHRYRAPAHALQGVRRLFSPRPTLSS